jgi:hypothetical protein
LRSEEAIDLAEPLLRQVKVALRKFDANEATTLLLRCN